MTHSKGLFIQNLNYYFELVSGENEKVKYKLQKSLEEL
jgi:hypothetical protein